jgi:hypothetical protein
MRHSLLAAGAGFALAALPVIAIAQQCWWSGSQYVCAPTSSPSLPPSPAYSVPEPDYNLRQYPPGWYYSPWDAPGFRCTKIHCGSEGGA